MGTGDRNPKPSWDLEERGGTDIEIHPINLSSCRLTLGEIRFWDTYGGIVKLLNDLGSDQHLQLAVDDRDHLTQVHVTTHKSHITRLRAWRTAKARVYFSNR